jgi:hypothetical protein
LNPSKITYLSFKEDYQWVVILLWRDAQINVLHRINGKLYTEMTGLARYQYAEIDLFFSRWSTSNYEFYGNLDTAGIGSDWSLVTCTYNGEKWWALRHTNTQAVNMYFMGSALNINFNKVHYYTSNTGTVVNSEVNSSIASKGDSISVRSVNGSPYALQKDINALSSVYVKKAGDEMTGNLVVGTGQITASISSQWGEFYIDISSSTTGGWERGFGVNINKSSTPVKFGFYGAGQSVSYAYAGLYSNPWQKWDNNTSTISTELVVNKNIIGLNREFSLLSGNEHFQHRYWSSEGSYSYEVFLLLPIPATTNLGGLNTIDGTISGYTNGANQCFWVDVKISTIYNFTNWNIKSISSFLSNQYVLKKCKYNDIWYYCIEIPYRDNRIDSYYFRGVIRSTIAGGLSTITLPYRIKYKTKANGNNAEVINNSEINSSLSTTLTQGGITIAYPMENTYYQNIKPHLSNSITSGTTDLRWKCVYSYNLDISSTSTFGGKATFNGGLSGTLTGSLSGNATTATTLQTSRTINGTSFNGSANITTSYWGTTRTIWGQSVNGSANVSGAMTGVTSITATGLIRTSNLFSAGDGGSDNAYGYYNCTRPNTADTGYVCYAMVRRGTYAFGIGYYNSEIVLGSANTSRQFSAKWLQIGSARLLINGNIEATGAVTAKSSSSDIRLKKNIKEYNALAIIHKLKSVKYYWNDTAKANSPIFNDNEEHYGLIAQDLLINGYSQWVSNCFKDYYVIQYERLIPVLWRGIQQVDNEVATLKKKIATLEKELSSVKRQLSL